MTSSQKKFDFVEIFVELYDKRNAPKSFDDLYKKIQEKIWDLYMENENDFQQFLEEVCKVLHLTKEEQELYIPSSAKLKHTVGWNSPLGEFLTIMLSAA